MLPQQLASAREAHEHRKVPTSSRERGIKACICGWVRRAWDGECREERRVQEQARCPGTSRASPRAPPRSNPANDHKNGTDHANLEREADDGAAWAARQRRVLARVRARRPCTSPASPRTPSKANPAHDHTNGTAHASLERQAVKRMAGQLGKQDGGEYFCGLGRRYYLQLIASSLQPSESAIATLAAATGRPCLQASDAYLDRAGYRNGDRGGCGFCCSRCFVTGGTCSTCGGGVDRRFYRELGASSLQLSECAIAQSR